MLTGKFDIQTGLKMYGLIRQGRFGDNRTPKPSILAYHDYVGWNAWYKNKGMNVIKARVQAMKIMEDTLKKFKRSSENPKLPGPDYYEGCFKKGKKKILVQATEVEDEEVVLESQESMMVDEGVPVASIIFLMVVYACCFCCIGTCVWAVKRKPKKE